MSSHVPAPYAESRPLPPYRAVFAVDAKDFTGLPAVQHGPVSKLIPELVDQALEQAGLHKLLDSKRFPANTGDGVVFGFDPAFLPLALWPFLGVLDDILSAYNKQCVGPRIRLRASLHVGPLPDADGSENGDGDGNGTARNDTHRLLDSRPVKAILAAASEQVTHLAAVISQRVYEDVVLGGYTELHPDRCVEVPATVEGKNFSQGAWLYVPSPSGNLLQAGVRPREEPATQADASADQDQDPPVTRPGRHYSGNTQRVGEGAAVMGDVGGDITYTGGSTYHGTNQHWGGGDNVSGDKQVGGSGDRR